MQKTLKGLAKRRQRASTMADDVKMALQRHPLNRHDLHTASPQFIDERNTRQNRHTDTSLNALFDRLRTAHFRYGAEQRGLETVLFQRLFHDQA